MDHHGSEFYAGVQKLIMIVGVVLCAAMHIHTVLGDCIIDLLASVYNFPHVALGFLFYLMAVH
jgi:ABC-type tungstate transport system substrate-binding protein